MTNTQTTKTTKATATKTAKKATAKAKVAAPAKVTAFLNKREKTALALAFHATKRQRLADSYAGRYVKNLANHIAATESTDKKIVPAPSVINDFRKGKFSADRLTENRIRIYRRNLSKIAGFELPSDAVERDIMRIANVIWKSGKF